jgi:hypothetical protein
MMPIKKIIRKMLLGKKINLILISPQNQKKKSQLNRALSSKILLLQEKKRIAQRLCCLSIIQSLLRQLGMLGGRKKDFSMLMQRQFLMGRKLSLWLSHLQMLLGHFI